MAAEDFHRFDLRGLLSPGRAGVSLHVLSEAVPSGAARWSRFDVHECLCGTANGTRAETLTQDNP